MTLLDGMSYTDSIPTIPTFYFFILKKNSVLNNIENIFCIKDFCVNSQVYRNCVVRVNEELNKFRINVKNYSKIKSSEEKEKIKSHLNIVEYICITNIQKLFINRKKYKSMGYKLYQKTPSTNPKTRKDNMAVVIYFAEVEYQDNV